MPKESKMVALAAQGSIRATAEIFPTAIDADSFNLLSGPQPPDGLSKFLPPSSPSLERSPHKNGRHDNHGTDSHADVNLSKAVDRPRK
jgi:hypothetical protein